MWMRDALISPAVKPSAGDRIYRVLVSRSAFLFRDFRSRMRYTIEIFCDTAFRDAQVKRTGKPHRSMGNAYKLPWKFSHLKFSLLFILEAFASAVFEMHAIAENP